MSERHPEREPDAPKEHKTNGEVKGSWRLESEQAAADSDQTASESDQTAADVDQGASLSDQAQSDADQRSSDRDQAATDRDLGAHPDLDQAEQDAYDASRAEREEGTLEREAATFLRDQVAIERDRLAEERDETARFRDLNAKERDEMAEARDRAAESQAGEHGPTKKRLADALTAAAAARAEAATARERASADRRRAAADREQASADRTTAAAELRRAHLDELTGAYRRGAGEIALRHEIERARRAEESLVLAYIDIDGLKGVNDRAGHQVGDALLCAVAASIQTNLRPYDPMVRMGGDEFVCTFSNADLTAAGERFAQIRAALDAADSGASISVGLAELQADETLEQLISRGDAALYEAKRNA